ncbi:hypothetical protein QJS10_CPA06g00310 [Acorus calamus]|uniref:Pectin acetylesterase n=1 Tax=Acorus calamus TaxID=4465 RepID=A0AAV9EIA9_ACOCL|nr:hypothetical protein QJS10_CPA06g00310 [Acorus calamus]
MIWLFLVSLCGSSLASSSNSGSHLVPMTLITGAASTGAVCLDGSPPAYNLHKGSGSGAKNWLLDFEGGGWCNDVSTCRERANSYRGSTKHMTKSKVFSGILGDDPSLNPDFYNWNQVKLRYCDGASFGGDGEYQNGNTTLYFRGQRIWDAIISDLLPKGLGSANKVLLSGCSAGGLATFLHCDDLAKRLPGTTTVKCFSDAGFFLDVKDVSGNYTMRSFVKDLVSLQGVTQNLDKNCTGSRISPFECFFPQYALRYIKTPYFVLNAAYDVFQFHHIFVPPSADSHGFWSRCKQNPAHCTTDQISILQGFRNEMLQALSPLGDSRNGGMFINSCFAHCQSELQETWSGPDSPRLNNKTIAEMVGNWYFEREVAKELDCPYPCDSTCHNVIS